MGPWSSSRSLSAYWTFQYMTLFFVEMIAFVTIFAWQGNSFIDSFPPYLFNERVLSFELISCGDVYGDVMWCCCWVKAMVGPIAGQNHCLWIGLSIVARIAYGAASILTHNYGIRDFKSLSHRCAYAYHQNCCADGLINLLLLL
jgi:hypothetical protein